MKVEQGIQTANHFTFYSKVKGWSWFTLKLCKQLAVKKQRVQNTIHPGEKKNIFEREKNVRKKEKEKERNTQLQAEVKYKKSKTSQYPVKISFWTLFGQGNGGAISAAGRDTSVFCYPIEKWGTDETIDAGGVFASCHLTMPHRLSVTEQDRTAIESFVSCQNLRHVVLQKILQKVGQFRSAAIDI